MLPTETLNHNFVNLEGFRIAPLFASHSADGLWSDYWWASTSDASLCNMSMKLDVPYSHATIDCVGFHLMPFDCSWSSSVRIASRLYRYVNLGNACCNWGARVLITRPNRERYECLHTEKKFKCFILRWDIFRAVVCHAAAVKSINGHQIRRLLCTLGTI